MPTQPENTTLCQVGFNYSLNYPFVSSTTQAAQQIFDLLPKGVGYGIDLDVSKVSMYVLEPYDTTKQMGYWTTFALFYIPSPQVNQLGIDLHTPSSSIYNNPDESVNTLMSMIVPEFPLVAGSLSYSGPNGQGNSNNGGNTQSSGNTGGDAFSGSPASQPVKSSSVIIGVSCAAGAAMYGAAMFYVARRYKNRKSAHARTSSVPSGRSAYASGAGGMWMSGGGGFDRNSHGSSGSQGRSVRTQQISAPVMAENSLGWN